MTDNARKTGAAVEAHFRFLIWLVAAVEKFLLTQKFLLGDRMVHYQGRRQITMAMYMDRRLKNTRDRRQERFFS
jgi:hypothetical protein